MLQMLPKGAAKVWHKVSMVKNLTTKGTLRICQFIRQNLGNITDEWMVFARNLTDLPLSDLQLRDHIHQILFFIADDVEVPQSMQQQIDKSHGKGRPHKDSAGSIHGSLRYDVGFNLVQMVMEYRALRASITKLWIASRIVLRDSDLDDLVRFNESIDQLLADSVTFFMEKHPARSE